MSAQPLKLFHVEVDFEYYVAATDEREARRAAEYFLRDAMRDADVSLWPSEVKNAKHLGREWRDEIPYAERSVNPRDLTCAQILDPEAPAKPDESVGPVHWCDECTRERVQFDGLKDRNLCVYCLKTEAVAA